MELRSGAYDEEYEETFGHNAGGISPRQAARIADDVMADDAAPSSTPLESTGRTGVPQGYGKWGDS